MVYLKINKQDLEEFVDESFMPIESLVIEGAILTQYRDNTGQEVLVFDSFGDDLFIIK